MHNAAHVLLIDNRAEDRAWILAELQRESATLRVTEIYDQRGFDEAIARGDYDLVITEHELGWSNGLEVLRTIKARQPFCRVIMFTASGNEEIAVESMKAGLDEYLVKSADRIKRLRSSVTTLLGSAEQRHEAERAEMRYRGLFDNVPVGLFVVAADGEIIEANPALAKILGYENRDALLTANVAAFDVDKNDAARFLQKLQAAGEIFDLEVHLGRPDGSMVWLLITARIVHDASGALLYYQGAVEDITERTRAEEAMQESEQRFETFMNHMPVIAFIKNENGRYEYANEPCLRLFKTTADEIYGKTDFDLLSWKIAETLREHDREVLTTGRFIERVEVVPDASGALRSWMTVKFPISDPQERNFVGGFAMDITERKRAEEAERRNEQRFRDLFQSSPDAIFVEDLSGNVLDVNPAACRLHGVPCEDLIGKNVIDLVPADKCSEVLREFPKLVRGELSQIEGESLASDGRVIPIAINAGRIEYQGKPALLLHVRDMSEHKRLQEQFLQAQKMEAIGRLAGGVAHDFNNLLTAILGYNELMLIGLAESDPLRRSGEEVRRAAERAAKLTRQLLAFSRKQTLLPRVLDLNATVSDIEKMLHRLIGDDVTLATYRAPEVACVKADPGQIEQVIVNLAVNARDAMPNGGKLTIRVENVFVPADDKTEAPKGVQVLLTVSDTGMGMTDAVKRRIFEPFFTTKEPGRGTGLGLATCYGIVKQSGGRILCQSETGSGTIFSVYLPRVKDEPERLAGDEALLPLPRGNETILVVEDSPGIRELSIGVLRSLDYSVLEAENGQQALQIIEERGADKIDLVVTDVMMPEMGGKELAERFREKQPDAKVLFNSGSIEHDPALHGAIQETGTAFLHKPFTPTDLARKVREVLDSSPR
jgi:two-component system cell cycle sensor histidine kinase/response regulator CckA